MSIEKLRQQFLNARKFGVPIIGIETPDMQATIDNCIKVLVNGTIPPLFVWDIVGGLRFLNKEGEPSVARASHVEPCAIGWTGGGWTADLSPVNGPVLGPFYTRQEALNAEVEYLNTHVL